METVIFKLDGKIKRAAQKEAKKRGFSLADFYRGQSVSLAEGRVEMNFVVRPKLKASVVRDLKKISDDMKKGKNTYHFKNVEDSIGFLKRL